MVRGEKKRHDGDRCDDQMPRRPRLDRPAGLGHDTQYHRLKTDEHFLAVARYVERNALRAKLVERAEAWQRSSVYRSGRHDAKLADFLSPWPMERPQNRIELVNEPEKASSELDALRWSAQRGRPFGSEDWMLAIAKQLGLEATLHPRGRPNRK